jgi:fumarylacetoacetase
MTMAGLNETHDPNRRSWIESANDPKTEFPIQNLPFGVFRPQGGPPRCGVAIGGMIFDLSVGFAAGLFTGLAAEAARAASGINLNPLMALGNAYASALRARLSDLLRSDAPDRAKAEALGNRLLVPQADAIMELPAAIGSFTDYLCSIDHTRRMSLTDGLPPSFKHLPIAYHSRSTSVRVSGHKLTRPHGQFRTPDGVVKFAPEPAQDFELELGAFVGPGNELGAPIAIADAVDHLFGFCLLNDWSARSIQRWESIPLGPFLGKSLMTTISPWIVTAEAMAPFRAPAYTRDAADAALPYLSDSADARSGSLDIQLEALLLTAKMRDSGAAPARVTATNGQNSYWTFAQMLTHHASNGCNLQPGDLLGSGTLSGPTDESRACLAEATERGTKLIPLPNGEKRIWIEDGDEIIFRGRCVRDGYVSIGFGECRGRIEPAIAYPQR